MRACVAVVSRLTCSGPKLAVQRERLLEEDKGAAAPSFIADKRRRPQGSSLIAAVPILGEKRERWGWGRSGGARVVRGAVGGEPVKYHICIKTPSPGSRRRARYSGEFLFKGC